MNNFLESLRNNSPTSFIDYLQTDKDKFYSCLIEEWAEEQLENLKEKIQQQASHGDYSISNDKKIIKGTYQTISSLISLTITLNDINNKLLNDFYMKELLHFFSPKFVKVSTRTERKKVGFFKTETVDYIDYKLEISNLGKRALKRLGELALEQGICLKKIGFGGYQMKQIMFDNMFELSKPITFSYYGGNDVYNSEIKPYFSSYDKEEVENHGIKFTAMFIDYSVTF